MKPYHLMAPPGSEPVASMSENELDTLITNKLEDDWGKKVQDLSERNIAVTNLVRQRQAEAGNKMLRRSGMRKTKFQDGDEVMVEILQVISKYLNLFNNIRKKERD